MSIFRRILFPVDFSRRCADAAGSVAAMARQFNAKVILIHATGHYQRLYTRDTPSPDGWIKWLAESAALRLQSFGEPCLPDYVIDRRVREGEPEAVIADFAANHEVDLIMMPTHGRGMFRRLLLGSVTAKVLHDSSKPVWTTAHSPSPDSETGPLRNILCVIDLSEGSCHVLETAARIACEASAALHVVHAVAVPTNEDVAGMECCIPALLPVLEEDARVGIEEIQREACTKVEAEIEPGFLVPVAHAAVTKHHADLLVVGRGHMHQPRSRLHTDIGSLIRDVGCPVLSI